MHRVSRHPARACTAASTPRTLVAPAPANVCFTTHSRAAAEEEGEEENDYDLTDKFLADGEDEGKGGSGGEEGEEDGEGGEEGAKKRRKKRRREALQLEEEDYDLLEENQVTVSRPGFPHEHSCGFQLATLPVRMASPAPAALQRVPGGGRQSASSLTVILRAAGVWQLAVAHRVTWDDRHAWHLLTPKSAAAAMRAVLRCTIGTNFGIRLRILR